MKKDKTTNTINRNNNFGMLHLMASFFVLYGHQYRLLNQLPPVVLGNQIHELGVKTIFLISGYLIAKSLFSMTCGRKKVTAVYLVKRIGRLFPEFLFCLIITAFLIAPLFTTLTVKEYFYNMDSIVFYIKNNLFLYPIFHLPGVFADNPFAGTVNGSLWTMPLEVAMYLCFLLIMLFFREKNRQRIVYTLFGAGIFILWSIKIIYLPEARWVFYGTDWAAALYDIVYFVIGGGIYFWKPKFDIQKSFFLLLLLGIFNFNVAFGREIICMAALSCCIFSLGFAEKQSLNLPWLHPECAYGVYLWGFPVQQCIINLFYITGKIQSANLLFLISSVIAYILARFSYRYIYKPFSKINNRIISYIDERL